MKVRVKFLETVVANEGRWPVGTIAEIDEKLVARFGKSVQVITGDETANAPAKLEDLTKKDLVKMAQEIGIDLAGNPAKEKIVELIKQKQAANK